MVTQQYHGQGHSHNNTYQSLSYNANPWEQDEAKAGYDGGQKYNSNDADNPMGMDYDGNPMNYDGIKDKSVQDAKDESEKSWEEGTILENVRKAEEEQKKDEEPVAKTPEGPLPKHFMEEMSTKKKKSAKKKKKRDDMKSVEELVNLISKEEKKIEVVNFDNDGIPTMR